MTDLRHRANLLGYQQQAWDHQVAEGNKWTTPTDSGTIDLARRGDVRIVLTPNKLVPASWFPPLQGLETLCLAGAGGQQTPILASAGAQVTVLDNSPRQLEQDQLVARREGLTIRSVQGRHGGSFLL